MYTSLVRRSEIRPLIIECCYREVGCESARPDNVGTRLRREDRVGPRVSERALAIDLAGSLDRSLSRASCAASAVIDARGSPSAFLQSYAKLPMAFAFASLRPQTRNIARSFSLAPNSLFVASYRSFIYLYILSFSFMRF